MTPYALLALTAPFLLLALTCIVAGWWLRAREERGVGDADEYDRKAVARRRRPSWADEPTPTYDALVCEHMERAEGWDR